MSSSAIDIKLPITGAGWVQFKIDVDSIEHLTDRDRRFVLAVIEKLSAFVPVALADPAHPAHPPASNEVPEVLRGLTGGRP